MEKYWLRIPGLKWQEVTHDKFIEVERSAGFYPKAGCGPVATAGFGTGTVEGKITYNEVKDKTLCRGCDSNFYNGNNPLGIKECWHFKDAEIVTRYRIGVQTPQDKKENFEKVRVLNCYTQTGQFAYQHGIPDHLI